ncbi:dihydroxyacetone kinase phosphoryl donor subunit DhaM [Marinivivus vitaminiproducens]|uniref:dihydroxyacetone kinase phosphoryl donor subunit DhaM n=1 Tax=Marinivivus vitaminiproducens TaxID=3035935 RepID=UPI00279EEBE1|nr:dihydroxyacetone kinase phosphoryl donor subunit DhaM [Geminicoccaceae bacterium SCSIO 64248]
MTRPVGLMILSHSAQVAEGTAGMVSQMIGEDVPLAWSGGDAEGGLGSDLAAIIAKLTALAERGAVIVLFDIGGTETHAEMAIETLPDAWRERVAIAQAPLVEGAVVAAVEATSGASLAEVKTAAEGVFS